MNAFLMFLILRIGAISAILFWSAAVYLFYLSAGFCLVWWETAVDTKCWTSYWRPHRRKTSVAAAILLISTLLPSTREATVMYVVPAISQSGIWERIFGHSVDQNKLEEARRWVRETVGD